MFVDTSAVVAMLAGEPEAASLALKLEAAQQRSAGHVILEASMRLSTLLGFDPAVADRLVTRLLREARISCRSLRASPCGRVKTGAAEICGWPKEEKGGGPESRAEVREVLD